MAYLSDEEFYSIYSKVPRLTVDVVIKGVEGIVLVQRAKEPWIGYWHLPGGTVYKEELIADAAKRIAKEETGLDIEVKDGCIGYVDSLHEERSGISMHTVSIVIEATEIGGTLTADGDAQAIAWHRTLPTDTVGIHAEFLREHELLV